jgi:hypothetical protein
VLRQSTWVCNPHGRGSTLGPRTWRDGRHQIFGGYDLPFAGSLDPGVGPDEFSEGAVLLLPALVALGHGCVAVEADFDFIEVVGSELGMVGAEIFDSIRFGIVAAIDVYSDEVIS